MHEDIKQAYHGVFIFLLIVAGITCFFWAMSPLADDFISAGDTRFGQLEARIEAIEATITKGHDRAVEIDLIGDKRPSEHFSEEDE